MIHQVQRLPSRGSFLGSPFAQNAFVGAPSSRRPVLGQFDWIIPLATGLLQATPAAVAAYNAKRVADRARQAKQKADADAAAADAAATKAQADAKAAADKAAEDQRLIEQGLGPQGTALPGQGKILGLDPLVLGVGSVAILGVGTALWMALSK